MTHSARGRVYLSGLLAFWAVTHCGSPVAQVRLEQSTYIGGTGFDRTQGCAIDAAGFIYVAGNTSSTDLPVTPGVVQPRASGGSEAFVAKFSPDLKQLVALSYFGGAGHDRGYGVNVDTAGDIYLSGITQGPDFPVSAGAYDTARDGSADVFLAKFGPDLRTLRFSTLLGGSSPKKRDPDWTRGGIGLDENNNIYLPGRTSGPDFPTTAGAFSTRYAGGQHDAFVARISATGSAVEWSTLIGGSGSESFYGNLALHGDGTVYAAGVTNSPDYPVTVNAYDDRLDGSDYPWSWGEGIVTRFNKNGSGLVYSTYLWGPVSGNDGLAVDPAGRAHLIASVSHDNAVNVPVSANAAQSSYGGGKFDMTVAILSEDGARVEYASFLGGKGDEEPSGIALDEDGNLYVGGNTYSDNFPVTTGSGVIQPVFGGGRGPKSYPDAFFVVLDRQLGLLYSTYLGGQGVDRARCIAYGPNNKVVVVGDTDGGFPRVNGGYDSSHNKGRDGFIALFTGIAESAGITGPEIIVTDSVAPAGDLVVDFGSVTGTMSSSQTVTVVSGGNTNLELGQISQASEPAGAFSIINDDCSARKLGPGAICTFTVRFTPPSIGDFSDSFLISSNDADEKKVTVRVSGAGVAIVPEKSVSSRGRGCSIKVGDNSINQSGGWWVLLVFLAWLIILRLYRRHIVSKSMHVEDATGS